LRVALGRLAASPLNSLYVGDRIDVDARAAEAIGVPCAILSRSRLPSTIRRHVEFASFDELHALILGRDRLRGLVA
jgi:FMN phosphatase YigB (HAD superfamily)